MTMITIIVIIIVVIAIELFLVQHRHAARALPHVLLERVVPSRGQRAALLFLHVHVHVDVGDAADLLLVASDASVADAALVHRGRSNLCDRVGIRRLADLAELSCLCVVVLVAAIIPIHAEGAGLLALLLRLRSCHHGGKMECDGNEIE